MDLNINLSWVHQQIQMRSMSTEIMDSEMKMNIFWILKVFLVDFLSDFYISCLHI